MEIPRLGICRAPRLGRQTQSAAGASKGLRGGENANIDLITPRQALWIIAE
jgi:hypothetical protein